MRFSRLRDKIEALDATITPTQIVKPIPTGKKASSGSANKKRKCRDTSIIDNTQPSSNSKVNNPSAEDSTPVTRRTRGKRINYAALDDNSSAYRPFEESGDEYVFNDADAKLEDEEDMKVMYDEDLDVKPAVKRTKKTAPISIGDSATPTQNSKVNVTRNKKTISSAESATVTLSAKAACRMHPADKPIPSIECSPPPSPASLILAQNTVNHHDCDIDIKSLQPGTFIRLPAKHSDQVSATLPVDALTFQENSVPGRPILSSTSGSTGFLIQTELDGDDAILPEDSISMVGNRNETSVTSAGKYSAISGFTCTKSAY